MGSEPGPLPDPPDPDPVIRGLTDAERALARSIYRDAIDLDRVTIRRRKWWWFQPREVVMAPCGHIHVHPRGSAYSTDFATAGAGLRGLFVHELCHVWQHQCGILLPIARHPFCRYDYELRPGKPFRSYGIEQQGEIVRHAWLLRTGHKVPGKPPLDAYEAVLPF